MGERRGTKGLELWCRRMTEGYPGVKIENMTTSWRDGLAFCAIIHHFRPELIDFAKLSKDDVYYNNDLAFTVAEKYLGIPALLEPEDMVEYAVPDRLSILTYLSQFYKVFVAPQGSPSRIVPKRPTNPPERGLVSPASTSPPTKVAMKSGGLPRRDPCARCGLPVFIAERLNIGKLLYHRTCFRCARCSGQLTLANYYETESKNQFCCETCPDEENLRGSDGPHPDARSVPARSLSDEEKSAGLKHYEDDDYSAVFETALESSQYLDLSKSSSLSSEHNSEFSRARSNFVSSQIENSDSDDERPPPDLPKTKPPDIRGEKSTLENVRRDENITPKDFTETDIVNVNYKSNLPCNANYVDTNVNSSDRINFSDQLGVAGRELDSNDAFVTKEKQNPSLIRTRMRLFETDENKTARAEATESSRSPTFSSRPSSHESSKTGESAVHKKSSGNNVSAGRGKSKDEIAPVFRKRTSLPAGKSSLDVVNVSEEFPYSASDSPRKQFSPETKAASAAQERKKYFDQNQSAASPRKCGEEQTDARNSEDSRRKSLSSLLEKQISLNRNKAFTVSLIPLKTDDHEEPANVQTGKAGSANYKSKREREERTYVKTVPKTAERRQELSQGKTGVSALKNLFEKSPSDEKRFPLANDTSSCNLDATTKQSVPNFLETPPSLNESISGKEAKLENKPNSLAAENIATEKLDLDLQQRRSSSSNSNRMFEVPSLRILSGAKVRTGESVDNKRTNRIPTRSDSNDKFVDLVSASSEIGELKQDEQVKEENISPSDNNESIIVISDTSSEAASLKEENISPTDNEESIIVISDTSNEAISIENSTVEISDTSNSETVQLPKLVENESVPRYAYPEDLNPFSDDDDGDEEESRRHVNIGGNEKSLNPFEDDSEEEPTIPVSIAAPTSGRVAPPSAETSLNPFENQDDARDKIEASAEVGRLPRSPRPAKRTKIIPREKYFDSPHTDTPEYLRKIYIQRISVNPLEEGDKTETSGTIEPSPPVVQRKLKLIAAPKISLNPFFSDDDNEDDDPEAVRRPVPTPRKSTNTERTLEGTPEPKPRPFGHSTISSLFGSNTSISSITSGEKTGKKKKLAPKPPPFLSDKTESAQSSLTSSPNTSVPHSPRSTPKIRKNKKAPPPPTSTPYLEPNTEDFTMNISLISGWEKEKDVKDEVNRNRQSQCFNPPSPLLPDKNYRHANKSTYGKWKRKKGPAPAKPIPQKRSIKALPVAEVRKELDLIELQQQGLEKQGVRLEQIIRDRCEGPDAVPEDTVPIDVEDLILQLFEVVNEKNELCRRQAELMYLQRQQRLEEEHADIEYQIRCLMLQPEANKTDSDKAREEELINRLVDVVERRNEIIECLDMDRMREAEEDDSISASMNVYASKRDELNIKSEPEVVSKKTKKKTKKEKKGKSKNAEHTDIDKDVDECESSKIVAAKEKRRKKFTIF